MLGYLTVIGPAPDSRWECRCICGNTSVVHTSNILKMKSCGCKRSELIVAANRLPKGDWGKTHLFYTYAKEARRRGYLFELTREQFDPLLAMPCHYCGVANSNLLRKTRGSEETRERSKFTYTGIDRVDNTIGYRVDNVVPCCKICNYAKHSQTEDGFRAWIQRVHKHWLGGAA